jgi:hypothetical protein
MFQDRRYAHRNQTSRNMLGVFYRISVLGIESRTLKSLRVKQSGKVTG